MSKRNLRAHLKLCIEMAEGDGLEQIRLYLAKAMKALDLSAEQPVEQPVDYEKVRYKTRLEMRKSHER